MRTCRWRFFAFVALAAVAVLGQVVPAAAEDVAGEKIAEVEIGEEAEADDESESIAVTLYPSPEPRPALKYRLLPPFMERKPGNAAVWWNRLSAAQDDYFDDFEEEYDPEDGRIGVWMDMRLGSAREKAYRENELAQVVYLLRKKALFADMERAARFESCDWQLPMHEGNVLLRPMPDGDQERWYARFLAAKAHLEIAGGKYDEAIRTLQAGYALSRHVTKSPLLGHALSGSPIAYMMTRQVRQLIQQPDAPNLYWALSALPRPLVDYRVAAEAESRLLYLQFPELRDLENKELSSGEWGKLLHQVTRGTSKLSPSRNFQANVALSIMTLRDYPRARRYLIERGRTKSEVEAMPVAQVVLLYATQLYDEVVDEYYKRYCVPLDEPVGESERVKHLQEELDRRRDSILRLPALLIPSFGSLKESETAHRWNIAVLRVFEAMRLYAASHDGLWPNRLSDITEVPVPVNPFDGKPFIYRRQGDKATLTAETGPIGRPWRYEITLRSKPK